MATKKELVEYIKTNLDKGYSEEQLRQALKSGGYSKTIIDGAFKQALKERAAIAVPPPPGKVAAFPQPAPATAEGPYQYAPSAEAPMSADTEKILSALAYPFGIFAIILLLISKPENKFGKFHGFQALFWWIGYIVVYILIVIILIPLTIANVWGLLWIGSTLRWLLWLVFLIMSIIYAIQAYEGKSFRVPIAYGFVPASARI